MSFSTSSRRAASCSLACWRVKVSFSFCETAWASWPLVSSSRSSRAWTRPGLSWSRRRRARDLLLGLDQPGAQGLELGCAGAVDSWSLGSGVGLTSCGPTAGHHTGPIRVPRGVRARVHRGPEVRRAAPGGGWAGGGGRIPLGRGTSRPAVVSGLRWIRWSRAPEPGLTLAGAVGTARVAAARSGGAM